MIIGLIAIILIILGLFLIIKGLMKRNEKVDVKAGGVILIGPFPIVVGDVRLATYMLILALMIILLIIILFIILNLTF